MQKELRIMPREDETKCSFGSPQVFICLLMMCAVEGGAGLRGELLGPLKAHSHGHCSAHLCDPRLRQYRLVT